MKRLLGFTALLAALLALALWGLMSGNSAEGAPQPDQPALSKTTADDDANGKDDSDGSISAADAEKAKAAALKITGGGTVQDVEKGDDGNPGWFEVEIQKADGTKVKVQLDENFGQRQGGTGEESESEDREEEGANDD